ncbi:MAG TPA: hypothetical protein DDZ96_08700 [Porphyromonadaceae bacterium]|nr:hypothetical protein [Porphyromonadaceae bacterium]HBL33883.1 hypothetical protein [Porphyromonadaceae bacterium]HBX18836.1 hypothetical protein [Porphyromonadaceae bacterium]HCM20569.1 hypothetical protein [Porphyromonadaceae bacterium]
MRIKNCFLLFMLLMSSVSLSLANKPVKRVILFTIDGLHWEAPQKTHMPVFNSLIKEGTYIQQSYVILPHHPTIGDYSKYNSCSFPNPVLHQGTLFLSDENKMIQEYFSPKEQTAFVVNTVAYKSVGRGFTTLIMDDLLTDAEVVDQSIQIMKTQHPVFMRIHLQRPGQRGFDISQMDKDSPYYNNIFAKGSPYVAAIENADIQLGRFIHYLKESGKWDETVLIITSDHGQSNIGWHALFDENAWRTPLLFIGAGIAKNRVLPYFEHTDIAPTIMGILGRGIPRINGGGGHFIDAMLINGNKQAAYPEHIKILNNQIKEYGYLKAEMMMKSLSNLRLLNAIALLDNSASGASFYHQDRILEWYKAGTTEQLIQTNNTVLEKMKKLLNDN